MGTWRERLDRGIVLASYRGPSMDESHPAAGGLASALDDVVKSVPTTWVVSGEFSAGASPSGAYVRPVALSAHERQMFYGGFSNRFYWMLAHGILRAQGPTQLRHWFDQGYRPANERFALALDDTLSHAEADTPVWIHDYHLFLVPELLRRARPEARVGFFLHVPWPSLAAWRQAPAAPLEDLVRGILGAGLVGLQTVRDAQRLLAAVEECVPEAHVQWHDVTRRSDAGDGPVAVGQVHLPERDVDIGAFPISIDPKRVDARAHSLKAVRWRRHLAAPPGVRTLVRVDRLDPAKNVLRGFEAYERLLGDRPDLAGRLRFLAFLVPSRESLPEYRDYRHAVLRKAEEINARFGAQSGVAPVTLFLQNNVEAALAGLSLADGVLINSLADGMNLVAKEMTVAAEHSPALVLSRLAGVAEAYRGDAILVDPQDVDQTAVALAQALDMPEWERARRLASMRRKVEAWTLGDWLEAQLTALVGAAEPKARAGAGGTLVSMRASPDSV